tara:strand:- start:32046 stop:32342 length:297 start_codon:yes stop_codon:yes gene_type:complete
MIKVNLQGVNKETKRFNSKQFFSPKNNIDPKILDYSMRFLFNRTKIQEVVEGYGHTLNPEFFKDFCQDYQTENKQLGNSLQSVEQGKISGVFCLRNKK